MSPKNKSTKNTAAKKGAVAKSKKNASVEDVELRILAKMADRQVFGVNEVSKEEVLKFAGYSFPTAARFIQATKSLKAKGYVEYSKETKSYRLTEVGMNHAPSSNGKPREQPKTNVAFHDQLKEHFESPKAAQMLDLLADGRRHERVKVCNALGYKYTTATAYAKSVKELTTLGFLEGAGRGMFQLTDKAFPLGRPE